MGVLQSRDRVERTVGQCSGKPLNPVTFEQGLALTRRGIDWHLTYDGKIDVSSRAKGPTLLERFLSAHQDVYGYTVGDALRSEVYEILCLEEAG